MYLVERTIEFEHCSIELEALIAGTYTLTGRDASEEWDASTTYGAGDLAWAYPADMADSGLPVYYESITSSNVGNDPTLENQDAGTNWLRLQPDQSDRLFDRRLNSLISENDVFIDLSAGPTGYRSVDITINPSGSPARPFFDTVWLGGIQGADTVRLKVTDDSSPAVTVYDQTIDLHATDTIIDGWSWRTYDPNRHRLKEALFWDVPGLKAYTALVEIRGSFFDYNITLAEFFAGQRIKLGDTLEGSEGGFTDYSEVTARNAYGDTRVVQQGYGRKSTLKGAIPAHMQGQVQRIVEENRAVPQLWLADPALTNIAHVVFGFPKGSPRFPWSVGSKMFCTIPLESVNQEVSA